MTEKQIERIKKKIRSLRAILAAEKRKFGGYDDSRGIRYYIPELFFKLEDYKGALRYFNWFNKEFNDDVAYPVFHLMWTISLFKNKKLEDAIKLAYKTAFGNVYLFGLLLEKDTDPSSFFNSSQSGQIEWAKKMLPFCQEIADEEFINWLKQTIAEENFQNNMKKHIAISKLLEDEPVGKQRSDLINAQINLEDSLTKL